ncbi:MAG: hypothetical protein D6763_05085, partial [Alphaproteobacteria bacterium]
MTDTKSPSLTLPLIAASAKVALAGPLAPADKLEHLLDHAFGSILRGRLKVTLPDGRVRLYGDQTAE